MILVFALASYLAFWPVPIEPVSWQVPTDAGLTGAHAANNELASVKNVNLNGHVGPESVAQGSDGKLYMGVAGGNILRMAEGGTELEVFANTGGRPLGLAFDADGRLIVADAFKGLLSIASDGQQMTLVRAGADADVTFPSSVAVAANGKL